MNDVNSPEANTSEANENNPNQKTIDKNPITIKSYSGKNETNNEWQVVGIGNYINVEVSYESTDIKRGPGLRKMNRQWRESRYNEDNNDNEVFALNLKSKGQAEINIIQPNKIKEYFQNDDENENRLHIFISDKKKSLYNGDEEVISSENLVGTIIYGNGESALMVTDIDDKKKSCDIVTIPDKLMKVWTNQGVNDMQYLNFETWEKKYSSDKDKSLEELGFCFEKKENGKYKIVFDIAKRKNKVHLAGGTPVEIIENLADQLPLSPSEVGLKCEIFTGLVKEFDISSDRVKARNSSDTLEYRIQKENDNSGKKIQVFGRDGKLEDISSGKFKDIIPNQIVLIDEKPYYFDPQVVVKYNYDSVYRRESRFVPIPQEVYDSLIQDNDNSGQKDELVYNENQDKLLEDIGKRLDEINRINFNGRAEGMSADLAGVQGYVDVIKKWAEVMRKLRTKDSQLFKSLLNTLSIKSSQLKKYNDSMDYYMN